MAMTLPLWTPSLTTRLNFMSWTPVVGENLGFLAVLYGEWGPTCNGNEAVRCQAFEQYARMTAYDGVMFGAGALMKCPFCREGDFGVTDSRLQGVGFPVRRRRVCERCKRRVWTVEPIEDVPLKVIKKDH